MNYVHGVYFESYANNFPSIDLALEYFVNFSFFDMRYVLAYIINTKDFNNSMVDFGCGKVLWVYYNANIDDKIIMVEKIQCILIEKQKCVNKLISEKSKMFDFLHDIVDPDKKCLLCGKIRICLEYCCFCFPMDSYTDTFLAKLKVFLNNSTDDNDCQKYINEVNYLFDFCNSKYREICQIISCCNDDAYNCCDFIDLDELKKECNRKIVSTIQLLKFSNIDVVKRAKIFVDNEYFNYIDNYKFCYKQCEQKNMKYCVEKYIVATIVKKHLEKSIEMLTKLKNIIKFRTFENDVKLCLKYVKHNENTKFLYSLLEEKELLQKTLQFQTEPYLNVIGKESNLRADFYFLFRIDGHNVPIYMEIDDSGHSAFDRNVNDILKDVCCLIYGISLIRVRPYENIMDILKKHIILKKYPVYRFYDGYFNNKQKNKFSKNMIKNIHNKKYKIIKPKHISIINYYDIIYGYIIPEDFMRKYCEGKFGIYNSPEIAYNSYCLEEIKNKKIKEIFAINEKNKKLI